MCDKDLEYYMRLTQIGGIYDDFQSMILQMASYIRNEDQTQAIKEHAGFKEPDRVRRTEADTYTHKRPEPSTNLNVLIQLIVKNSIENYLISIYLKRRIKNE